MQKIKNHAYHSFCLNITQKIFFLKKTCFKSEDNTSYIDLFITNSPNSFENTSAITTGLSDFHKMVTTVLKATFTKSKPKVITNRDFKLFNQETF